MSIESLFPQPLFSILGIWIRDTVAQTWIVVAILGGVAIWGTRRLRVWEPETWQLVVEYLVEYIENLVRDMTGRQLPMLVPYLTTMISFIAVSNLLGLLPIFMAPTRDLNTTAALSLVSWGSCQYFGIRNKGLGRQLRSYVEPVSFMLPLNILSELSRVISMALRLFGNVVASEVIGGVMFMLLPLLSPLLLNMLGMITGVLQALVFTVLTLVFVTEALGDEATA
jgi:F-type H+-transporting ATPase subunit a